MNWFWSLYAIVYDFGVWQFTPYWDQLSEIVDLVVARTMVGDWVCDFGCGTGNYMRLLFLRNRNVVGIDPCSAADRVVWDKMRAAGYPRMIYCGRFDVIVAVNSLYACDRLSEELKSSHEELNDDGFMVISNPIRWPGAVEMLLWYRNRYGWGGLLRALPGLIALAPFNLVIRLVYRPIPEEKLVAALRAAGFRIVNRDLGYICDANVILVCEKDPT